MDAGRIITLAAPGILSRLQGPPVAARLLGYVLRTVMPFEDSAIEVTGLCAAIAVNAAASKPGRPCRDRIDASGSIATVSGFIRVKLADNFIFADTFHLLASPQPTDLFLAVSACWAMFSVAKKPTSY